MSFLIIIEVTKKFMEDMQLASDRQLQLEQNVADFVHGSHPTGDNTYYDVADALTPGGSDFYVDSAAVSGAPIVVNVVDVDTGTYIFKL